MSQELQIFMRAKEFMRSHMMMPFVKVLGHCLDLPFYCCPQVLHKWRSLVCFWTARAQGYFTGTSLKPRNHSKPQHLQAQSGS